ncbi:MAG TPA: divergent polysaccharide deacetylase family protein [Methylomirabilota bacterium]|nr:divergent polysaccharide deacetylase family protein [Methylomirabilota bacterium]
MAAAGRSRRGSGSKKRRRSPSTAPLWWIAAAAVVVVVVVWMVLRGLPGPAGPDVGALDETLRSLAAKHGAAGEDLRVDTEIHKVDEVFVRSWTLRFPDRASLEEFIAEVTILGDREEVGVAAPAAGVGGLVALRVEHGVEAFDLELGVRRDGKVADRGRTVAPPALPEPSPTRRPTPEPGARGRLAIILDDGGQRMDLVPRAARLPEQVAIAVLPFLPYSAETALAMHEAGHEVWLHLPMEAEGGTDPGPGALMVDMTDDELRDTVFMAVNNVPHVVGVNNHMGSRATANLKMMTWVMQDLAAMGLGFIDSRTTVDTVAEEAARAQGVKAGRRHVFLDNERDPAAIRRQLDEAVERARIEGEIIAIGHLNEVTVGVLSNELPRLAARGADLVAPTALLR